MIAPLYNTQQAPFPKELADLVDRLQYRPGWEFWLEPVDRGQGSGGLTLDIITMTANAYHPEITNYRVHHYMPVPPAAYDERSWRRWLFEQVVLVETHECAEFFQIDGERPYAPHHGPGNSPYYIFEHADDIDRRTSYLGNVKNE
jgi:hypothetical protein